MINFIIGENASGKSMYLDLLIKSELKNNSEIEFVTNLHETLYSETEYVKERLDTLEEISLADEIDTINEIINISGNPVKLSKDFLQLMTILCKKSKRAYIDEPEQGLSEYEINLLGTFLTLANHTYEDIFIVTHSELLIEINGCRYMTPQMDNFTSDITIVDVKEADKFEIID